MNKMKLNTTIKVVMLTSCMLMNATSSYAWLDKIGVSDKLNVGEVASQALNGITGSNKKQTNNDECDIVLDYIPSGVGNSREDLCREQAKQKSLDPQITGNFNLTLGSKFDKSLCAKELDFYVCEIDAQNNKYFDEAQVVFNPESLELVRITSFKDIKCPAPIY